jgi:hypothetical protein
MSIKINSIRIPTKFDSYCGPFQQRIMLLMPGMSCGLIPAYTEISRTNLTLLQCRITGDSPYHDCAILCLLTLRLFIAMQHTIIISPAGLCSPLFPGIKNLGSNNRSG